MSQSRPAPPEPSEIAGRYQVVQKLGAGAFGTVYKAKDKVLKRMVAIKTIRLEGLAASSTSLDELLSRFRTEAETAAQLKHPNIVTIYDIGDAEGLSYLAMEFIDGVGLDRVIASEGGLPLERAAGIAAQVADALDFAYRQKKVVHRDIKPANIMLETGDRVKVTDFGIAKPLESGEHLTVTGSILGTPSYMSPEQAKGEKDIDGRSDIFSLGCVLYEMIAGKKAFRGDSITALIFKIITEEPPPLRELATNVPEEMIRIVAKALAKKPDERYQSGREMASDLQALTGPGFVPTMRQAEVPTTPVPAGAAGPPTVRTAPTARVPSTVAKAPPAPPTAVSPRPSPPPPPLVAAPPARRGGGAGLLIALGLAGLLLVGLAAGAGWFLFLRKPAEAPADAEATTTADAATVTEPTAEPPGSTAAELPPATTGGPPTQPPAQAAPLTTPAQAPPATRPPAVEAPPVRRQAPAPTTPREPQPTADEASFLDEEPPPVDGRQAGEDLAAKYKSRQGGGSSTPWSGARFRARPRSPRNLALSERPAVATLRHIIDAEEAFHGKHHRYGTFEEMKRGQTLFLDVPFQGGTFQRRGYRFELTVGGDGFKVTAIPLGPGPRPFRGDDSGFILAGLE